MIDPNRLKDVSAFLEFAVVDLAPKLAAFHHALAVNGIAESMAVQITIAVVQSIIAVPSPVEGKSS